MYIMLLDRDKNAPFNLYAENQKSGLISGKQTKKIENLAWENLAIRNYCIGINTQADIDLKKIPNIPEYQAHARQTATKYLDEYVIKINNIYNATWNFCTFYEIRHEMLKSYAKNIVSAEIKEKFKLTAKGIEESIVKINDEIKVLISILPGFRKRIEKDTNNFKTLTKAADSLIEDHGFEIIKLEEEIADITQRLDYLNKAIPGYASMSALGLLGIIVSAVIVGMMLFTTIFSLGASTAAVIGAGIGLTASGSLAGVGSGKLYDFIEERKEKNAMLTAKNKKLAEYNKEKTIAENLKLQLDPFIKNSTSIISQIQNLYEGWNSISENFKNLLNQVNDANEKTGKALEVHLETTSKTITQIKDIIKRHEKAKLITTEIHLGDDEKLLTNLSLSHYYINPTNKVITLPTELALAFAR